MKDLPVVYVARPLLRRGQKSGEITTIGYIASKAYLLNKNISYVENGLIDKEFTVEYIGLEKYNERLLSQYNCLVARGIAKTRVIFDRFESCKECTSTLNRKLISDLLEKKGVGETIEIANVNASIMRLIGQLEENDLDECSEDGAYNE